jgi:8-oxo-dGTP pyrophosphatase MutT (NUDIX family)
MKWLGASTGISSMPRSRSVRENYQLTNEEPLDETNLFFGPGKEVRRFLMSDLKRARPSTLLDIAWQMAFRMGFPLARLWWQVRRPQHKGVLVAIYVGQALVLVRPSYQKAWNLPGGGIRRGETPEIAARRELAEEIGFVPCALLPAGSIRGTWDGRRDHVYFFELRLDRMPMLQLDNREIVAARLVSPGELRDMALTGPVATFLERSRSRQSSNDRPKGLRQGGPEGTAEKMVADAPAPRSTR